MIEAFSDVTFEELPLQSLLKKGIESLGFSHMTPIQQQAIPYLLEGRDVIGQAQTGTGKTAAFGLPLLDSIDPDNRNVQALILCPTRELAMQICEELRNYAKFMQNIKILPVYGGQEIARQIRGLKGVQIVVGTPGRIMDHMRRHTIKMKHIQMVVLDEADEMLNMGFREDMEVILGEIKHGHQTCLFSATMPKPILEITDQYQNNPKFIKVTSRQLTIDRIEQLYYGVKKEYKYEALIRLLTHHQYKRCMIFSNTKTMVDELLAKLLKDGWSVDGLHGDMNQKQRDIAMNHFRDGKVDLFVCTDIAARGIDIDDVEAVINYDVPQEIEYYVHRIGRTARAGKEGVSHTLCTSSEFKRLRQIEELCHSKMKECSLPSNEDVLKTQERLLLESIFQTHIDGHTRDHINAIYNFCKSHQLSLEDFALASFKNQLNDSSFQNDIELPAKKKKVKNLKPSKKQRKHSKH